MDKVYAPWDAEQVALLNKYQHSGEFHGYTCPRSRPECIGGTVIAYRPLDDGTIWEQRHHSYLLALEDGWICPRCLYRQTWAWSFMH